MIITIQAIREAGSRCGRKITRAITARWTRKSRSAPSVEKNEYSVMPNLVLYQSPAPMTLVHSLLRHLASPQTTVCVCISLTSSITAVDRKGLTDGKRSEVGAEKEDHPCDLFRLRETANGKISHEVVAHSWIVEPRLCHCCFNQTRSERVDPDSF